MTHSKISYEKSAKNGQFPLYFGQNVKWGVTGLGWMENDFAGINVHQNAPAGKNISTAINPLSYLYSSSYWAAKEQLYANTSLIT